MAGAVPPVDPASRAMRTAGKACSSSGSKVQVWAVDQSTAGAAPATRSGQPSASAIGIRMSGGLACAIVDPSVNSTIEWTTDCRCTTTSIASKPIPNSRWASITSRPLLTSVAELTVMTGPMFQVGWASACSGVTCSSSARLRCRNGPPLAVSTSLATSPADPPRRHCAIAECSESTGTIWPGRARPATSGPPAISDSLFASASTRPARSAARVAARPLNPVTALSTTSQGQAAASVTPSGPARTFGCARAPCARRASLTAAAACSRSTATTSAPNSIAWLASRPGLPPPAASPAIRNVSRLRRMTSAAWVPIDPVEPSRTTLRGPPREESTPPLCPVWPPPRPWAHPEVAVPAPPALAGHRLGRPLPVRAQRHPRVARRVELDPEDLVQRDHVPLEPESRAGHVQPPHPRRARTDLGDRLVPVGVEVGAPPGQGEGVVLAQVLLVPDLEPRVVHSREQVPGAFQLTVGKHVPVDEIPRTGRIAVVRPGDAVVEQPPARLQLAVQEREVGRQVGLADVFGEADRAHRVEGTLRHVPVVEVAHLGQPGQPGVLDRPLGPGRLLRRQRHAQRLHAVLPGGVADHAAPPAADVKQPHAGPEPQLPGDQVVLVLLRLLQRRVLPRVAGAGVGHRRPE